MICSRPDWHGVPGIANSDNLVLISQYERGLDKWIVYVVVLRLSRVAEQGPGITVGLGGGWKVLAVVGT
jgi:hypothetical protein